MSRLAILLSDAVDSVQAERHGEAETELEWRAGLVVWLHEGAEDRLVLMRLLRRSRVLTLISLACAADSLFLLLCSSCLCRGGRSFGFRILVRLARRD